MQIVNTNGAVEAAQMNKMQSDNTLGQSKGGTYSGEKLTMELIEIVIHAFESIIKKYNMQSSIISENEVVLFSDKYILSFLRHSGELEMVYIEKKED